MKIALRMDDITADMNWDNFFRLKELFDKAGVRPLLGVVPDNRDASLSCMKERADFWELLLELQEDGTAIDGSESTAKINNTSDTAALGASVLVTVGSNATITLNSTDNNTTITDASVTVQKLD